MQESEANPLTETLDPLPPENLLELEKRRKRAERFGMPVNAEKVH